jgi:hypothetical protein
MTNELHLIDEEGKVATIKTEWTCYTQTIENEDHIVALREKEDVCQLVISEEWSESTALPSPKLVRLSHIEFKITPYVSNQALLYSGVVQDQDELYTLLQYPWFWVFGRMYHRLYGWWWSTNAKTIMHQYYNTTAPLQL